MTSDTATEDREELEQAVDDQERPTKCRVDAEELPGGLRQHAGELEELLNRMPPPAKFPEDQRYPTAHCAAAVCNEVLIPELHPHLGDARIAYCWRERITSSGEVRAGNTMKASGRVRELFDVEFFVDVSWDRFVAMSGAERVRLLDHELSHIVEEDTADGPPKLTLRSHDVREFLGVMERWGPAAGQQEELARVVQDNLGL